MVLLKIGDDRLFFEHASMFFSSLVMIIINNKVLKDMCCYL